jgi:ATP-binding cassette subfamily F protein 3
VSLVRLAGVSREVGDFVILDGVAAAIAAGDRVGLVGPNGAGKTTLLRILAGTDEPDRGEVVRRRNLRLGLLAQEAHLDESFVSAPDLATAVRRGADHLDRMGRELAELESGGHAAGSAYADLQHQFEALGGYTLDQRVDETLSGLGFSRADAGRSPRTLSGGEQTRAALARLVVADPELLLLDEPTNHLDLDALEWLELHLRRRAGSLVVASHDRAFLDAVATRVWELRDRRLTAFRGNYSAYHRQREERDARASLEAENTAAAIAREKELVQRYRSHRKFSKMHEHEARLERLEAAQPEARRGARRLRLPGEALLGGGPSRSGESVVRLDDLVVGYLPGRGALTADGTSPTAPSRVARAPFLTASRGERIGIVGPNGAGKTTLLRTIAGELPPLDGSLTFGKDVRIGHLAQLRGAALPGTTVLDALLAAAPVTVAEARTYLARFLFRGDDVQREVRLLSGGERSRLELALLGITPSNLLLLDEPTNHLDIVAREAIEAYLATTAATILVVSHDRRFLETVCERLWVVADGLAVPFDGGYRAWREAIAGGWTAKAAAEQEAKRLLGGRGPAPSRDASAAAPTNGARPRVQAPAAARPAAARGGPKLSKDAYRRQKVAVDGELTRLGLRKNHLELAMADPAIQSNFVELRRVTSELADVEVALAAAEDAWLALEERAP